MTNIDLAKIPMNPLPFTGSASIPGDLTGKTVVVVGLASSGRAAAALAAARGAQLVVGMDVDPKCPPLHEDARMRGVHPDRLRTELGPHDPTSMLRADLVVVSPGVPVALPQLEAAMRAGVPALSELAFAAESLPPDLPIAAVTGTNGKSTVATFTGQLLEGCGVKTFVGGNLGTPLSEAALEFVQVPQNAPPPYQAAVVEASSYQLQLAGGFHPTAAVIINLTPDHLERHGSMRAYGEAKCAIFKNMQKGQLAVVGSDNPLLAALRDECGTQADSAMLGQLPGCVVEARASPPRVVVQLPWDPAQRVVQLDRLQVVGGHNVDNAGAAALMALALGLPLVTERGLERAMSLLHPPPHRMQLLGATSGVLWIDDSKATNVESTAAGLRGLDSPAVVLLGGQAKKDPAGAGLGFGRLAPLMHRHRAVVTFGASGPAIFDELRAAGCPCPLACCSTSSMRDAVRHAREFVLDGDAILLSPGCASFDEFDNFMHRGRVFAEMFQDAKN